MFEGAKILREGIKSQSFKAPLEAMEATTLIEFGEHLRWKKDCMMLPGFKVETDPQFQEMIELEQIKECMLKTNQRNVNKVDDGLYTLTRKNGEDVSLETHIKLMKEQEPLTRQQEQQMIQDKLSRPSISNICTFTYAEHNDFSIMKDNSRIPSGWNLYRLPGKLTDLFKHIYALMSIEIIAGVVTSFVYGGCVDTLSPLHVEYLDLSSVNYLYKYSRPKLWIMFNREEEHKLNQYVKQRNKQRKNCVSPLLHHDMFADIELLNFLGIKWYWLIQRVGDIVYTNPGAAHMVYNLGYNLAEAVNIVNDRVEVVARRRNVCSCQSRLKNVGDLDSWSYLENYIYFEEKETVMAVDYACGKYGDENPLKSRELSPTYSKASTAEARELVTSSKSSNSFVHSPSPVGFTPIPSREPSSIFSRATSIEIYAERETISPVGFTPIPSREPSSIFSRAPSIEIYAERETIDPSAVAGPSTKPIIASRKPAKASKRLVTYIERESSVESTVDPSLIAGSSRKPAPSKASRTKISTTIEEPELLKEQSLEQSRQLSSEQTPQDSSETTSTKRTLRTRTDKLNYNGQCAIASYESRKRARTKYEEKYEEKHGGKRERKNGPQSKWFKQKLDAIHKTQKSEIRRIKKFESTGKWEGGINCYEQRIVTNFREECMIHRRTMYNILAKMFKDNKNILNNRISEKYYEFEVIRDFILFKDSMHMDLFKAAIERLKKTEEKKRKSTEYSKIQLSFDFFIGLLEDERKWNNYFGINDEQHRIPASDWVME